MGAWAVMGAILVYFCVPHYLSLSDSLAVAYGMVWYGMAWHGMAWHGMAWDGMGWDGMGWDGMGWDGMGWDGMGWDGMGWDGMGWDGMGAAPPCFPHPALSTLPYLLAHHQHAYTIYYCHLIKKNSVKTC